MEILYTLLEFIYLVEDQDPIYNIVQHDLTYEACKKIAAERPIEYKGHRAVSRTKYKIKPTADMKRVINDKTTDWLKEVNVGNFLSIESGLRTVINDWYKSINENTALLKEYMAYAIRTKQERLTKKIGSLTSSHNEKVKIYEANRKYLVQIYDRKKFPTEN